MTAEQTELVHGIMASEYAKIQAVRERIAGLRMGMVATAIAGTFTSFLIFELALTSLSVGFRPSPFQDAFQAALIALVPFLAVIGFLSYRVNKHITRLSQGKFEPPAL